MFRIARNFASSKYTRRFFSNHLTNQYAVLPKLAAEFEQEGNARAAEDIYKKYLEKNPTNEQAYLYLFDFWRRNCSLKVTKNELDDFMNKYQKNIKSTENSLKTPKPG